MGAFIWVFFFFLFLILFCTIIIIIIYFCHGDPSKLVKKRKKKNNNFWGEFFFFLFFTVVLWEVHSKPPLCRSFFFATYHPVPRTAVLQYKHFFMIIQSVDLIVTKALNQTTMTFDVISNCHLLTHWRRKSHTHKRICMLIPFRPRAVA